ncbi:hypothetical protein [Arsenicicoccus sp. oral taxon 190]|uniref:hypothetical protein n=1 Tax=Arsenicicoccus sp. oral taxon 190 TaxID=1658671 RepID=UPI00067BC575|nr:hypothetical protein [Arsenicicoccus sp. oral taxon 190]
MQKRLMFIVGAGLGYVLGARAGHARYEQIKAQADTVWHDPRVQEKVALATDKVKEQAPVVQERAQALAAQVTDKVKEQAPVVQERAQTLASSAQTRASDAASTVRSKVSRDHSGNQIGVEKGSDVEPHEVKFESGR